MLTQEQNVAAVFVIALFYGLYLSTLFHCIRWLCFTDEGWSIRKKIDWPMFAVTGAIFALSTVCHGVQLHSFMQLASQTPKMTPQVVGSISGVTWILVVLCTNKNATTLIADAVLIYRCWVLWKKSIRIISLPLFLWVGGFALTGLQAYVQIVQSAKIANAWLPVNMSNGPGIILTPFWATTIIVNLYTTVAIVYRLYSFAKETDYDTSIHLLRFVTRVLVESGFLYLTVGIAHFVVWWTPNDFAITIISWLNLSIIGIAFNLILIRLAQNLAKEGEDDSNTVSTLQFQTIEVKSVHIEFSRSSRDSVIEIRNPTRVSLMGSESLA